MSDIRLIVDGSQYVGWISVRVVRSMETLSGSFSLTVSDRWSGQPNPLRIDPEARCQVAIDDEIVIDGHVERRQRTLDATSRTITLSGYDLSQALVANSAPPATYRQTDVVALARILALPHGISVSTQPGLTLPPAPKKTVVHPADSIFDVLDREAMVAGVLMISDSQSGIIFTRTGTASAQPLVEGLNIKSASYSEDASHRFREYRLLTQTRTSDATPGSPRVRAIATDQGVKREARLLIIRPEAGITTASARQRADWEARVRAGRSATITLVVQGWRQPNGELWPVNTLTRVKSTTLDLDTDRLITQTEFSVDRGGGEVTTLRLMRPDAFEPQPEAVVKEDTT